MSGTGEPIIVDGMSALRKAAENHPDLIVTEDGKVALAEGVEEATIEAKLDYVQVYPEDNND